MLEHRLQRLSPGHRLGLVGVLMTLLAFMTLPFIRIDLAQWMQEAMGEEGALLALFGMPDIRIHLSYLETMAGISFLLKLVKAGMELSRTVDMREYLGTLKSVYTALQYSSLLAGFCG